MSFDWADYLILAQELVETGSEHENKEAMMRSAISRAYYAVFCQSRNYLRDSNTSKHAHKSYKAHRTVIDSFIKSVNKIEKKVGLDLDRLRAIRNKADYEDTFYKLENETKLALQYAKNISEDIKRLKKPS